ncbi:MAG: GNAT family N-acetyltransferase [Acidobacteriaceae bacterium]|nr:GNAT family N-acetyltransferase [Acidobacteriaceae bacterium]
MIVIRSCKGHDELEACVRMQIDTWGYDPTDVIPRKAFLVMQKVGGQVLGAFDTEQPGAAPEGEARSLVGFAMSLPGMKTGEGAPRAYLHSHMLAVKPEYRNRGLGAQLKLEQRREALGRGIERMEWTFDPLEIKNAYLNIHKLGAVIRRYSVDFYGVSSSRLQGGLPTDRLTAEWYMKSPRVTGILEGRERPSFRIEERIEVPAAIYAWKANDQDRSRAMEVQLRNRQRFQEAFSNGLAVLGFVRDEEGNGVFELGSAAQLELE